MLTASRAEEPGKDKFMATSNTILRAAMTGAELPHAKRQARRRRITPDTGRALVILGHAIEYLADEFAHEGRTNRGQVDAIQLLMAVNRQMYMACPEVPTFGQWLRSLLHRELKQGGESAELTAELGRSSI
jgi:hypothetical protein